MVRYKDRDVLKRSPGKEALAGKKQIFRHVDEQGVYDGDIIGMRIEQRGDARLLLCPVMQGGQVCRPQPSIEESRRHFRAEFECLPENYKRLVDPPVYPVRISAALQANQKSLALC